MPGNEVTVKHNVLRQREHNQLPGHILQRPEIKWVMQREPDKKGLPISWDENIISATLQYIWLTTKE